MASNPPASGADHFRAAAAVTAMGWGYAAVLQLFLFLRPTPYGTPYMTRTWRYLRGALWYEVLGIVVVSLPALLVWLALYRKNVDPASRWKLVHRLHLAALVLFLVIEQIDHEVMRFLGTHLSIALLRTYQNVSHWGNDVGGAFGVDRGGVGVPFVLLAAVPALMVWSTRRVRRAIVARPRAPWPMWLAVLMIATAFAFPYRDYSKKSAHFLKWRVKPEIFTLAAELVEGLESGKPPANFDTLVAEWQERWLRDSRDPDWTFPHHDYPLYKVPTTPPPAGDGGAPWNVIVLQLETLRGWDVGYLRPDRSPSPTPYLDSLARDPKGAYWVRCMSYGPPTVSAFMATTASIRPHSTRDLVVDTWLNVLPLAQVLRKHGYQAEHFDGGDPEWDNEAFFMRKWNDRVDSVNRQDDIPLFERAGKRIKELGRSGKPFMITIKSRNNHYPFRTPDPAFNVSDGDRPTDRVLNTTRYTDEAVKTLIEGLRDEPFFARTLVVAIGDHGYDLGEHGVARQRSGWHESIWVPLLVYGDHPRLVKGRREDVASLIDLAPTVADLLGIREPNHWTGMSLAREIEPSRVVTGMRDRVMVFAETGTHSMLLDPASGIPRLFDSLGDQAQVNDLAAQHLDETAALLNRIREEQAMMDHLIITNRLISDKKLEKLSPP